MLVVVSLLALGLGIERSAGFESLEQDLKRVESVLHSAVPFKVLVGEDLIFREAARAVQECGDSEVIRATGISPSPGASGTEKQYQREYLLALVERIQRAKERGGSLSYRWVIADVGSERKRRILKRRVRAFTDKGILDRFLVREFAHTWPMEMLIAGNVVVIGFSGLTTGALTFRVGVSTADSSFAWHMAQWYDDFLWTTSQVLEASEV